MIEPNCRVRATVSDREYFGAGGRILAAPGQLQGGHTLLCKEYSHSDDVMNLADSACVTVSNIDGANTGRFRPGQLVQIDLQDPSVGKDWVKQFTGIVTQLKTVGDQSGGDNIMIAAMDLGWLLTTCHTKPHQPIRGKTFAELLKILIEPAWKIGPNGPTQFLNVVSSNDLNKRLKLGRAGITQAGEFNHFGNVLPAIQTEPGQTPFDVLQTYAQREGWLVNVTASGDLVFFQPNYNSHPVYAFDYHADERSYKNNIVGSPTLTETIDGLYSEVQVWSTAVLPAATTGLTNNEDPNSQYRHDVVKAKKNPLPFYRRQVITDSEAINSTLRKNRATWKLNQGIFNSWTYEIETDGLSQGGCFFASDTMVTVRDDIRQLDGNYYVQSVHKSLTVQGGERTTLTIKLPGLLQPALESLSLGGGAKKQQKNAAARLAAKKKPAAS